MLTRSGHTIDFNSLETIAIELEDIAYALSNQCRYNGHCNKFFSVAEHSVLVSKLVWFKTNSPQEAKSALLHDASEAYMGDIVTSLKKLLPDYLHIESELQSKIYKHFNLSEEHNYWTLHFDNQIVPVEMNHLFKDHKIYVDTTLLNKITINCWSPETAYTKFIKQFYELSLKEQIK